MRQSPFHDDSTFTWWVSFRYNGAMKKTSNIHIILCRPEGSLNVGSACRAMKTMGFSRLSVVDYVPLDEEQIQTMAVHAYPVYRQARHFATLKEALQDSSLAFGVSRRRGSRRKTISLTPEEGAQRALAHNGGEIALVFGNEQNGLTEEEMNLCSLAVHIPSSPEFPSLNLSHAVQLVCAAFFREATNRGEPASKSISWNEADEKAQGFTAILDDLDYFNASISREQTTVFLRDILSRAALSPREMRRLESLLKRAAYRGGIVNNNKGETPYAAEK